MAHSSASSLTRSAAPTRSKTAAPASIASARTAQCCQNGADTCHSAVAIDDATTAIATDAAPVAQIDVVANDPSAIPIRRASSQPSTAASTSDASEFDAASPLIPNARTVMAE